MERREILRYIGIASVAATFPGFKQWAVACVHSHDALTAQQALPSAYKPLFFSPQHFKTVEHLAEMIIPEDDTPGAKRAGVAEVIDFMVANRVPVNSSRDIRSTQDAIETGNDAQERFLARLGWMNARSHSEFGREFMDCTSEQQNALLEELAYKAKFKPTTESGRAFFQMMRDYTVVGFYTTKIGLESLGYSGLRSTNYVDIDPDKKDIFEIPQLRFHFQWGDNELLMWQHSKQVMVDLFKAMGGEMWGMDDEPNRPGTSLHETGVCRFGNDPKTSVTNKWARTHGVPNLYIRDASIFPNCTDKTTTMPIVACAMRNCDHMLDNFKKGVHKRA